MASKLKTQIGKKKPFEFPHEEVILNIHRTWGMMGGPAMALLKKHDLSSPLYNILRILRGEGGGLPCSLIADRMLTRVPDVTRLIDRLLKAGLVNRERSVEDRRVVTVSISAAGKRLVGKIDQPMQHLHRELLGHLTRKEMADLNRLLEKAREPQEP